MKNNFIIIIIIILLNNCSNSNEDQDFHIFCNSSDISELVPDIANNIDFVNINTGWITNSHQIFKTINNGISWEEIIPKTIDNYIFPLLKFDFVNTVSGYALNRYDHQLYKTGDSGKTWNKLDINDNNYYFSGLNFASVNNGIVYGRKSIYFSPESIVISATSNGGLNWTTNYVTCGLSLCYARKSFFIDQNIGYIIGDDQNNTSFILKTIDGGLNWSINYSKTGLLIKDIFFLNSLTGWIVGSEYLKTTDGGITWNAHINAISNKYISQLHFVNSNTGYVRIGSVNSIISKTVDSGSNWYTISSQSENVKYMYMIDSSNIYYSDSNNNGFLIFTSDQFQNFSKYKIPLKKSTSVGVEQSCYPSSGI